MKVTRLFQKTRFGIYAMFAFIGVATSILCIWTVDSHLTQEYESNGKSICKIVADASVDIILNRDLSSLQALIDQFSEIQGVSYIYIKNEEGVFIAHTFVPGIPIEILEDESDGEAVERNIPGLGDFVEVSHPILAGVVGRVHIGMDPSLIALKIQHAIGQQIYLISGIFFVGFFAATWFIGFAAKPLNSLLDYAVNLAKSHDEETSTDEALLARTDEVGHLARLYLYFERIIDREKILRENFPTKDD